MTVMNKSQGHEYVPDPSTPNEGTCLLCGTEYPCPTLDEVCSRRTRSYTEKEAEACDCGHATLNSMFHLSPCPLVTLWDEPMKQTILPWPEDGSPVSLQDIVEPLREAIDYLYTTNRLDPAEVPYVGYDVSDQAFDFGVIESLNPSNLSWSDEQHGRDALEVVLALAVRLGIEQGRRVQRTSTEEMQRKADSYFAKTCGCSRCLEKNPPPFSMMILCSLCGNKRCPHAADHRLECTRSNEPGQPGSNYPNVR